MTQPKYFPSNNWEKMVKPKPHTNEHWFCLLSTEEKAKVFANATYSSACLATEILFFGKEAEQKKWELWLKQPHTNFVGSGKE